ncbi:MAG: antitermination regulator [Roseateles depolymerans]|uniref:Antitermination regulator n=1 Tax=Roseateles depolymerans TaxID=76731 RepID=A0A2W5E0F7_9BURK|nr:MAG: antitermination regulator [Roseateles depolymerans]
MTTAELALEWVADPSLCQPAWARAIADQGRPPPAAPGPVHRLLLSEEALLGNAAAGPQSLFSDTIDPTLAIAAGADGVWPCQALADAGQLRRALLTDAARWHREQASRTELARVREQLDERRWIDRAKGVLMQARGLSEEEAFRLLRGASMQANLRVGEVSRAITEAAQWAEAVNRAGQLRMLSQRVVLLAAERLDGQDARRARQSQGMAIGRLQDNLDFVAGLPALRDTSPASQALEATVDAWRLLKPVLQHKLTAESLAQSDALAEELLTRAEALTELLEAGGARRALRLVNLCGRQRMRVQRLAKQAMLAALLEQPGRLQDMGPLLDAVESTLTELEQAPLGSPSARSTLTTVREQWLNLLRGLRLSQGSEGRHALVVASDALLELFDRLTADYEHSLQMILS